MKLGSGKLERRQGTRFGSHDFLYVSDVVLLVRAGAVDAPRVLKVVLCEAA